jgi:hypothetical protein
VNTIYTWGYTGNSPADLQQYLQATGACLLDIRFRPWSRVPGWQPKALIALAGPGNYRGVKALGNVNYNTDGPILLLAPAAALPVVRDLLGQRSVLLLCGCVSYLECHRSDAARYLAAELAAPVVHLPGAFKHWEQKGEQTHGRV